MYYRHRCCRLALAAVTVALLSGLAAHGAQRPISDFLDTQGSQVNFVPPVPDYLGWNNYAGGPLANFALVDYAGVANEWLIDQGHASLGTEFRGTIHERLLKDGRAEVTVILHTRNALAWAALIDVNANVPDPYFLNIPLLFGNRAQDVAQGAEPALAKTLLKWVYIAPAPGLPIPDVVYRSGVETLMLQFHATAVGELHELAGLGPDGTLGMLLVNQVGLLGRGSGRGATEDGFPVEFVELRAIGR